MIRRLAGVISLAAGLAVASALTALSWAVVAADRETARADAVRLALWRLDAQATALLLAEASRPLDDWEEPAPLPEAPIWLRAVERDGDLVSPAGDDPEGARRLAELRARLTPAAVIARAGGSAPAAADDGERENHQVGSAAAAENSAAVVIADAVAQQVERKAAAKASSSLDYSARSRNALASQMTYGRVEPTFSGPLSARWLDGDLLIERPLRDGGRAVTVVAWNTWEPQLLREVAELLPEASLRRADDDDTVRLASIPVALDPGTPPPAALAKATRWTLAGAWIAGLGGLAAVLAAMVAAGRLAERRAAFVSAVTHELRTPLTALRLHGDLLADARVANDPLRRAAPVAAVRDGALRLAHLIDNVLDYARLERRNPPAPRSVTLDALLPELIARLPGLEIAPLPAASVRCDPQAVERILANLADNAAKYGAAPYTFSARLAGRTLEMVLVDHGPGLAPDARAQLFTPFARSAEAAAGNAPGVGLGLALCRRLARAQGGDLRIEDAPDGGVRAVLSLRLG